MKEKLANQKSVLDVDRSLSTAFQEKKGGPIIDMFSNSQRLLEKKTMPEDVKSEMEQKFHADLSNVKLYEGNIVSETGANAYAGGSSIAFAPGKLDFSSFEGKKLLGHELSHVVGKTNEQEAEATGSRIAAGEEASSSPGSFESSEVTPMSPSQGVSDFSGPVAASKRQRMGTKLKSAKERLSVLNVIGRYREKKKFRNALYGIQSQMAAEESGKNQWWNQDPDEESEE